MEQERANAEAQRRAEEEHYREEERYREALFRATMDGTTPPSPPPLYVPGMGFAAPVPVRPTGKIDHYYWVVKGRLK